MAQEFMYLPNNSANKQGYSLSDPLGGFIAEVESGAGLQAPDAAAVPTRGYALRRNLISTRRYHRRRLPFI